MNLNINRTTAILALVAASLGGGLVASFAAKPRNEVPIFMSTAQAASVEPSQMLSFSSVVKRTAPAVVKISSTKVIKASDQRRQMRGQMPDDPFFRQFFGEPQFRDRRESGEGSGVIVSPEGYILTNNHVVDGATTVKVLLSDRRELTAKVIGADGPTDVALIKIDATKLPVLPLSTTKPEVGDITLAIGNPLGVGQTVTMGIVSAVGRNLGGTIEQYEDFIQTDAAINHGNSGGALINTKGELIGINTAILSPNGGNLGIGFAIPVSLAKNVMDQLLRNGKVARGYIGALPQDIDPGLAKAFKLPNQNGALLARVDPDTPAEKGGLKAGDVVVAVNGETVQDAAALRLKIASLAPGATVKFSVIRDGQPQDHDITLKERPANLEARSRSTRGGDGESNGHQSGLEGVSVDDLTPQLARQLNIEGKVSGVIVTEVDESSAAAEAGLTRGDIITQVNRTAVKNADDFDRVVKRGNRGDQTLLQINRQGVTRYIAIETK